MIDRARRPLGIVTDDRWASVLRSLTSGLRRRVWHKMAAYFLAAAIGAMAMTSSDAQVGRDAHDVLRLLLNAPQLTQYYHFDKRPERAPLRLVNTSGVDIGKPDLTAAGQKVVLTNEPSDKAIEITRFTLADGRAEIAFTFRVEGVLGNASFNKIQGNWALDKLSVAEK